MEADNRIYGRRAVMEAMRSGQTPDKLYILRDGQGLGALTDVARQKGGVVVFCDRVRLDQLAPDVNHQGVVAVMAAWKYAESLDQLLEEARAKGEDPFLVVCDSIEDPGNFGAILRTCDAVGATGVIIPKRRSVGLTPLVAKTSAGALAYVPVLRVPGIPAVLHELKKKNIWLYGAAAEAESSVFDTDFSGGVALVMGSEDRGLSRLSAELCDFLVSIPMRGQIASLNVSAAAAVMMYQVVRSRQGKR